MFVLERDFVEAENVPRAVQAAFEVLWALRRKEIDWSLRREEIEIALKVACDALGGSAPFAYNTVMLAQPDLRDPERWEKDDLVSRAVRRACDLTIMAEVAHRCERYRQAVVWSQVALHGLREASPEGTTESLLKATSSSKKNPLAAASKAAISILIPAIRRSTLPPQVKDDFYGRTDSLVAALLVSGQTYGRSDAFASQTLFREAEKLRATEEPDQLQLTRLVELREIAQTTWPKNKRAQATAPLVEMEYRRAVGEVGAAREQAILVRDRLLGFALPRHLERMAKYRYLEF